MECLHCRKKGAKHKGQYVKSRDPYVATAYYWCPSCSTSFTIDKTVGEVNSPNDPEEILKRVLKDIANLPKSKLKLLSETVSELL